MRRVFTLIGVIAFAAGLIFLISYYLNRGQANTKRDASYSSGGLESAEIGYIYTMLEALAYKINDRRLDFPLNNRDFYNFVKTNLGDAVKFSEDNPFTGYLPPAEYGYCVELPEGANRNEVPLIWWPRTTCPNPKPPTVKVVFWSGESEWMSRQMLHDVLSKFEMYKFVD